MATDSTQFRDDRRQYYYRISFYLRDDPGHKFAGIRAHPNSDIDVVHLVFQSAAHEAYPGRVEGFEIVQLTSHHPDVKAYLRDMKKPKNFPMEEGDILVKFKGFCGMLHRDHPGEPISHYQVLAFTGKERSYWYHGQFNKMLDGWHYYPNAKGFKAPGFEEYLISLVAQR